MSHYVIKRDMIFQAQSFSLTFVRKIVLTKDIYSFFFSITSPHNFLAGQYLQITLPHDDVDARGSSRFFTIASAPGEKYVMITTRKGRSSFKKKLFQLQAEDVVEGFGPMGKFTLPV